MKGAELTAELKTLPSTLKRRYRPYPEYKDSGVEWLGEVPRHWEILRIKYASEMNRGTLGESTQPDFAFRYIDIGGVDSLGRIVDSEEMIFSDSPSRARRIAYQGDIAISTVRTYLRAITQIGEDAGQYVFSTGFAILHPTDMLESSYFFRSAQSEPFIQRVVANSEGVGYPAISPSKLAAIEIPLPTKDEQHIIAAFLDRETAKIDALIAKKERLIGLLKEKRTALIARAVTKGLDPTVPLKDSGVEWLGEIPAHWKCLSLSRVTKSRCDGPFGSGLKSEHYTSKWSKSNQASKHRECNVSGL